MVANAALLHCMAATADVTVDKVRRQVVEHVRQEHWQIQGGGDIL